MQLAKFPAKFPTLNQGEVLKPQPLKPQTIKTIKTSNKKKKKIQHKSIICLSWYISR